VAAKLAGLTRAASPSWNNLVARGPYIFAIHIDPARQQPTLVTLAANADPATQHMLLDPNALDTGGHTAIDWFVPSQDGSKVAVSLSRNGSEDGTLHVYEVASGKEIDAPIPRVQYPTADGALAWSVDGTGFWYTRYPGDEAPESERHVNQTLWFHVLGQPEATDTQILSARDGIPRTGEIMLDNRAGGSAVLASVQLGDGGQWQQFVLKVGEKPVRIADYGDRIVAGAIAQDGTVYGLSRLDAPTGKVLKLAPPYTGGFAHAATIIARRNRSAIIDGSEWTRPLTVTGSRLFVTRIAGGPNSVSVHGLDGRALGDLPLPPISSVRNLVPLANGRMLYNVASYTRPPHYENWNPATGKSRPTSLAQTSPVNYDDVTVTRIFATSKDGTRVPLNIIAPKGIPLDGSHPTLLYGYGGYGLSLTPTFLGANWRLWLDSGGVLVMANIRGGGEYGDSWHRQGMLTHRQAVFDDFAAAGEALIAHGYTSHARLAWKEHQMADC
jgi:prolyl oligopeptidase